MPQNLPGEALLIGARDVASMIGVSKRTLYRMKREGHLPQAIVLGRAVRWRVKEIRDWVDKGCLKPLPSPADTVAHRQSQVTEGRGIDDRYSE